MKDDRTVSLRQEPENECSGGGPLRILMAMDTARNPDSGSAGWLEMVATHLRSQGHHVDVMFEEEIAAPLRTFNRNLSSISDTPVFLAASVRRMERLRGRYDIVELWDPSAYLYALVKRLLHRGKAAKFVFNRAVGVAERIWREHVAKKDIYPPSWKFRIWHPYIQVPQERFAFRRADAVFVASNADYEFVTSGLGIPASRVTLTPPGVLPDLFASGKEERSGDLLFVGTWIERKGISYLVQAIERIHAQLPHVNVTIVGVGSENIRSVYRSFPSKVHSSLSVYGSLPTKDLGPMYRSHKILLLPSLSEGFVRVGLEGMAAGLCLVASRVGGAQDLIEDGINGYLVTPRDSRSLADRTIQLLRNHSLQREIRGRAVSTAQKYTWEKVVGLSVNAYRRILSQRRAIRAVG